METEEAIQTGFVYLKKTLQVISDFPIGSKIYYGDSQEIFYGSKNEAIKFGLIFNDYNTN